MRRALLVLLCALAVGGTYLWVAETVTPVTAATPTATPASTPTACSGGIAATVLPTPTPTATPTATPTSGPSMSLPARFTGNVTMFGKKPSGNVNVTACLGLKDCGAGKVTSGAYSVNVKAAADAAGCGSAGATVAFKLGDYWANETGSWSVGVPQTLALTGPKMKTEPLGAGCNQATITFSNKTPAKTIREAVEPTSSLVAIWWWNSKTGMWDGDFPGGPDQLNTLKALNRLDIVWLCTTGAATLNQPAIDFLP